LLGRSLQAQDHATAEKIRTQLYSEHPKDLAAARDTADSSWQAQQYDEAYSALAAALRDAYPQLTVRATLQAAQAATAAGGYESARLLLLSLSADDPSNSAYISAVTDSYAQQSDREALLLFYQAQAVEIARNAGSESEKTRRLATLERGTIAGLTRLGDYTGALDHYIELLEREPNGTSVAEAVRYAGRHGLTRQLADHYAIGSSADSPQHPLIAARLRDLLEETIRPASLPAALDGDRLAVLRPEDLPASPPAPKQQRSAPLVAELPGPATPVETALRPSAAEDGIFCIQIAAYKELDRATRLAAELQQQGYPARADSTDGYDRVLVGDFKSWRDAASMAQQLKSAGYETWLRYVPAYERAAAR
jgi:cell division septation protein DedD